MFITRESDYAVRIVRALALDEQARLCVNEICQMEDFTPAFAYKILKKLEKAGIVQGFRGSQGGYKIKAELDALTLWDIYQAVEPTLFMISCMEKEKACSRNKGGNRCNVHHELCRVQKVLQEELCAKSILEILRMDL